MKVTAFAPATVANVAVGFDILGFSVDGVGDEVTVSILRDSKEIRIEEISGVVTDLPSDPAKNTASVALRKMIGDLGLKHGFSIRIKKGIPLSSGMGGSAASAVAAVVAANGLLEKPFPDLSSLLEFALAGEAAASGAVHGDNVGPSLLGGLQLILPMTPLAPMRLVRIDVPEEIYSVLIHPDLKIETRQARAILRREVALTQHVEQSAWLAGFLAGCLKPDLDLIGSSMRDIVIEPQRSQMIPGFEKLKTSAMNLEALGFSISGSGPSVFAWARGKTAAAKIGAELIRIFAQQGIAAQSWVSPIATQGARVIS